MTLTPPAFCTDLTYPFSSLRMLTSLIATPGIDAVGDMAVSPGSGLQVSISAGKALISQTGATEGSAYDGLYFEQNDAVASPYNTISAPLSNPRIDLVILRVYDVTELGISGASFARFEWVQGAENASASLSTMGPTKSNPGAPALPQSSLLLSYVLQTVGEGSVSSGNILNVALLSGPHTGAWQPLILASNWGTGASKTPRARLMGDIVQLDGTAQNNTGSSWAGGAFATVPSSIYNPPLQTPLPFATVISGGLVSVSVTTSGNIQSGITAVPNGDTISLTGLWYPLS